MRYHRLCRSQFCLSLAALACVSMVVGPAAPLFAQQPPKDPLVPTTRPPIIGTIAGPALSPKLDLKYIPAPAVALLDLRPQSLLVGPNAEWMPVEVITAAGMQHLGVDPVKIEEAIVVVTAKMGPQPEFGVVVRFTEQYDKAAVMAKIAGMTKTATVKGKSIQQAGNPNEPSFYLEDAKTIVIAPESMLTQMLAGTQEDSPLRKLVGSMDFSAEATLVGSMDAVRDQVKALLAQAPPLPPPLQPYLKLPDLLSAVLVRVNIGDNGKLTLTFKAVDEKSAAEVEQLVKQGLEMGRQAMQAQMAQEMKPSNDPVQNALAKYLKRVTNLGFDKLQPVRKGTLVTTTVPSIAGGPATIGILIGLLLPAVQAARAAAERNSASNRIRQMILAMLNYESANRAYPPRAIFSKDGKPLLSWRVAILPYIEEANLYNQFHLDEPWDSEHNKALISQMPSLYAKPGAPPDQVEAGKTVYVAPVGKGLMFDGVQGTKMGAIRDGTSKTILIIEANDDHAVTWTKPDDLDVDLTKPKVGLGSSQPGGFLAGFCDGHVMLLRGDIKDQVLKALFTRDGAEPIDDSEL